MMATLAESDVIRQAVRREIQGPIKVYYPGMGGGSEALDFASAWKVIDPDQVVGVDVFEYADGVHLNKHFPEDADPVDAWHRFEDQCDNISRRLSDVVSRQINDKWESRFNLDGRPRRLELATVSVDAREHVPEVDFNVIYSKRTVGVVSNLPPEVIQKARVIVFEGEYLGDAWEVDEMGVRFGFNQVDLNTGEVGPINRQMSNLTVLIKP